MSTSRAMPVLPVGALLDYFADREGLSGTARRRFVRFARDTLGYGAVDRTRRMSWMGHVAMLVAGVGVVAEARTGVNTWTFAVWCLCEVLGFVLALCLARAELRQAAMDPEVEWRIYCHLMRPVILAEHPGLLDRNLTVGCESVDLASVRPENVVVQMFRERGTDLWVPAAVGWSVGLGLVLAWRMFAGEPAVLSFILPVLAALAVPIGWSIGRWLICRRVEEAIQGLR